MSGARPHARSDPGTSAPPIPRDEAFDATFALLREGYRFVSRRCERYGSDAFETRLMLRQAVCVRGADATRMFYEPGRFTRRGALPPTTLRLLQDKGSVQQLDGEAHRLRKRLFLDVLSEGAVRRLCAGARDRWRATARSWPAGRRVRLLDAVSETLCASACRWAGIPLADAELPRRTRELMAMIEQSGSFGPRAAAALLRRARSERWMRSIVERARDGRLLAPSGSPLAMVAAHRDLAGDLLDARTAAVELLNLLRPTVAAARFVVFAALAMHEHPQWRAGLAEADESALEEFVQEVRRYYPFFPLIGGRVREPFDWHGRHFPRGAWVLLDVFGTNRDPRLWHEPDRFDPSRFRRRTPGAFEPIAQGGGGVRDGHRCPGERATIALTATFVRELSGGLRYRVPPQDLSIDLARMPAAPASRFVVEIVEPPRAAA
jgi:fatty-acid peroxygenase